MLLTRGKNVNNVLIDLLPAPMHFQQRDPPPPFFYPVPFACWYLPSCGLFVIYVSALAFRTMSNHFSYHPLTRSCVDKVMVAWLSFLNK